MWTKLTKSGDKPIVCPPSAVKDSAKIRGPAQGEDPRVYVAYLLGEMKLLALKDTIKRECIEADQGFTD